MNTNILKIWAKQIQQYIRRIVQCEQVRFIPGIQGQINTQISVNVGFSDMEEVKKTGKYPPPNNYKIEQNCHNQPYQVLEIHQKETTHWESFIDLKTLINFG